MAQIDRISMCGTYVWCQYSTEAWGLDTCVFGGSNSNPNYQKNRLFTV